MNKLIKFIIVLLISNSAFSEDTLTIPTLFTSQCESAIFKKIANGTINLKEVSYNSKTSYVWQVYSDRDKNQFYKKPNEGTNGKEASFLDVFYVIEIKDKWMHLVKTVDELDMGWIHIDNLLLNSYSILQDSDLTTDPKIFPIPKKAVILTSIYNLNKDTDKRYFSHPEKRSKSFNIGIPKKFESLFVYKESGSSVLLGANDNIVGPGTNKFGKILGWIDTSEVQPWPTRLALENSNTEEAKEFYGKKQFFGFKTQKELERCIGEQFCNESASMCKISIGPTRNNKMRRPVFTVSKDGNIFRVATIYKDEENDKKMESILSNQRKKHERVNIVFVIDATSSMSPYYKSIARSLDKVIEDNKKVLGSSLRFGVVLYRDYLDGDDAFEFLPLDADYKKVKSFIRKTQCKSKDNDLPEAQFNGLINGLSKVGLKKGESNIVVLIGDCGNHEDDIKSNFNDAVKLFVDYKINLVAFQVDSKSDYTYLKFNEDVFKLLKDPISQRIAKHKMNLNVRTKEIDNHSYKISLNNNQDDYQNMFGVHVYSNNNINSPKELEGTITNQLRSYIKTIENNISKLEIIVNIGGPSGSKATDAVIFAIMEQTGMSEKEARIYVTKTEFTVPAFVALDYDGSGINTQIPVVLLTEQERTNINKSLKKIVEGTHGKKKKRFELQKNLIYICKSIIGQNTSTDIINNLTMNDIWQIILGVEFKDDRIPSKTKLKDLSSSKISKKDFKEFYDDFSKTAKLFYKNSYHHKDHNKDRRFLVGKLYKYWIPLNDFPGCNSK